MQLKEWWEVVSYVALMKAVENVKQSGAGKISTGSMERYMLSHDAT